MTTAVAGRMATNNAIITGQPELDGNISAMDALDFAPGNYRGTYKLIGGRPSLDFINTVCWPGTERAHDWLDSVENLKQWLRAVGMPAARGTRVDLQVAVDVRAALAAVLRPLAHGEQPAPGAMRSLNEYISGAGSTRVIDPATLTWTWKTPEQPLDLFAPVILDAAELIATGKLDRFRHCPSCDRLFEDQTRNAGRRWCDMGDCGSRDKSRRYYRRTRQE
jgi:predicted RNA-binding Zn ribbon-like protein